MQHLTTALKTDIAELAKATGVTVRTVKAWVEGIRRPAERNRAKLLALVVQAQEEHSAAEGRRWSAVRDAELRACRKALRTKAEQAAAEQFSRELAASFENPKWAL